MRDIEKEVGISVAFDEIDRPFSYAFGQEVRIGIHFDDGFSVQEWERWELEMILSGVVGVNVMTVGNSELLVESLTGWKKSRLITEMPFAE